MDITDHTGTASSPDDTKYHLIRGMTVRCRGGVIVRVEVMN